MTAAEINGITIEYELHGPETGEPVLLVMGLGAQLVVWPQSFIDLLTAVGYRLITFDNRDVGRSGRIDAPAPEVATLFRALTSRRPIPAPYSLADMADDAAGLLRHLGIAQAHVVGVSMGGMISQELTIRHPELVATLTSIMSNTGLHRTRRPSSALLPALIQARKSSVGGIDEAIELSRMIAGPHFDAESTRQVEELEVSRAGDPGAARDGVARQTLAVVNARDRTADLASVKVPTLVVHGLLDRLVRPAAGIATSRAIPGSRLVMYPDMAHDIPASRIPEITDQLLVNFRRAPVTAAADAAEEPVASL